jgi:hypothetical protein
MRRTPLEACARSWSGASGWASERWGSRAARATSRASSARPRPTEACGERGRVVKHLMNPYLHVGLAYAILVVWMVALVSCTKEQRSIVHTVVDIIDQVCGDKDTVDECLGKAQAARAAARAGASADAGTPQDAAKE